MKRTLSVVIAVLLPLVAAALQEQTVTISDAQRYATDDAMAIKDLKREIKKHKKKIEKYERWIAEAPEKAAEFEHWITKEQRGIENAKRAAFDKHNLQALRALKNAEITCHGLLCDDRWVSQAIDWRLKNSGSRASHCYLDLNHDFTCKQSAPSSTEALGSSAVGGDIVISLPGTNQKKTISGTNQKKEADMNFCYQPAYADVQHTNGRPYWGEIVIHGMTPSGYACGVCNTYQTEWYSSSDCTRPEPR